VRIWAEAMGDGQTEWRDKARHVPSGETRYFRDWSTLVAFLLEMLSKFRGEEGSLKRG